VERRKPALGSRSKAERAHRPRDILYRLLAEIIERGWRLVANLIADCAGDAETAGLAQGSSRAATLTAVAKNVVCLDDDVADIDADAESEPFLRSHGLVARCQASLNGDRTNDRVDRARALGQDAVSGGFDDASPTGSDVRVDAFSAVSGSWRKVPTS
jgi:hypothetical protein